MSGPFSFRFSDSDKLFQDDLSQPASKPIPFGKIGDMLSDISEALAADTPPPPRPGLPFGDQMSLPSPRSQIPSNQASPVELNPLSVTPPMQRPGDQAIQALARLYPGLSL